MKLKVKEKINFMSTNIIDKEFNFNSLSIQKYFIKTFNCVLSQR